ncbi:MAG: hypothetical protein K2Y20_13380 [Sphingomonas sp.]|nr:hypothetical protein [Sphingomonas sp.]
MTTYHEFDKDKIDAAIATIKAHGEMMYEFSLVNAEDSYLANELSVLGACVDVVITKDHKVCIKVPIFGNKCINVPSWIPAGAKLSACATICGKFIPTGVKITVSFNGQVIVTKVFGKC